MVYKAEGSFLQKALDLAERYFQTRTLAHHYLNMAKARTTKEEDQFFAKPCLWSVN